jgi:two-component system, OmpR family, sensor kinase
MNVPLKTRLTLWYITLFAVIAGVWSAGIVALVRADLYAGLDRDLASRASQIALSTGTGGDGEFQDVSDATLKGVPKEQTAAQLLSVSGVVLESSGATLAAEPIVSATVLARTLRSDSPTVMTITRGEDRYRVLIAPLPATRQLILVGTNSESADDAVTRLVTILLLTGPAVLLAAGGGGWFLAKRALRPVTEMTTTAAGIGIDRLDERVPVPPGSDELSALAATLNTMLSRLETGVRDKRRLVADASHELQTPLAVMRTELDVSLASGDLPPDAVAVLESAREETDRMTRIVRNLLTLARFDEGTLKLLRQPVDLTEVAVSTVDALDVLAHERGVDVAVVGEGAAVADGDAEYLRLVVANLVENAIRYSGEGSRVEVTARVDGDEARVVVRDTGHGIPAEALPHIFDRFYRVDTSRSKEMGGSGLGLAISREIAEAHGGRIDVESDVGRGSTFTVVLPVAALRHPL